MIDINDKSGFTLIEVLLATVITAMIMTGLHQVMNTALLVYEENRNKQDLLARAHYAVERMVKSVQATDSIAEPDTNYDHEILQVSERLLDTYNNTTQAYLIDGDGILDADNDADSLVNEGGGDTAETITFSLDKTDANNWKLIEQMPDYSTAALGDFTAPRVISEHVTAFASHLVGTNLVEIELTLADGSETATLKTRALATLVESYVSPTDDLNPPTPDPMTWAGPPAATGSCSIAMTASEATDKSLVEYYFECIACGDHDSDWQAGTLYTDSGLTPSTSYTYRVKARDQSADQNETGWSTEDSATTDSPTYITVDSFSISPGGETTTESWSHSVTSAENDLILIVGVAYKQSSKNGDIVVESVTYGGQNLSRAGIATKDDKAGSEIWSLTNPPTGNNTVEVTMEGDVNLRCGAISFFNVDQTIPLGTFSSATGNSTSPSVSVAGVNEFEVVLDHLAVERDPSASQGPGQTMIWNVVYSDKVRSACSTEDGPAGGGSVTMSWTLGAEKKWALGAVVLKPASCP